MTKRGRKIGRQHKAASQLRGKRHAYNHRRRATMPTRG